MSIVYEFGSINLKIVKTYGSLYFCSSNNLQKFHLNRKGFTLSAFVSSIVVLLLDILAVGEIRARTYEKYSLRTLKD